jgi:putative ABC transport system substrate-binding protein
MNRRDFITLLGGAIAWPLAARAQQGDRVWRIGVLMGRDENDPVSKSDVSAFTQALAGLGWVDGRNVRMDLRWSSDTNRTRAFAQELVRSQPDIIVTSDTPTTVAVQRQTRTIPIVFFGRGRSRRQRPRPSAQPAGQEHHRLRRLRTLAGRQVA